MDEKPRRFDAVRLAGSTLLFHYFSPISPPNRLMQHISFPRSLLRFSPEIKHFNFDDDSPSLPPHNNIFKISYDAIKRRLLQHA